MMMFIHFDSYKISSIKHLNIKLDMNIKISITAFPRFIKQFMFIKWNMILQSIEIVGLLQHYNQTL